MISASQPGPQWTPGMYQDPGDTDRLLVPYTYVITHDAVGAATTVTTPSAAQFTNWPFLWTTLHVGSSDGDEPADEGFSFLLQDEGGGSQQFMSSAIMSRNLFGSGPIALPVPWLFGIGHSVRSQVENLDQSNSLNCYVSMGGWLVQPKVIGQWEQYGLQEMLQSPHGYPLPNLSGLDPVPFFYNVRHPDVGASNATTTVTPAFQVGTRPFEWTLLSAAQEAGTAGFRVEITDNRTRQGFSDGRLPTITLMQHGPIVLPTPWRMTPGASMQTLMENLDSSQRSGRITFGGVLL